MNQIEKEMAAAEPDSIMGLMHSINQLAREHELVYFVTDGQGNTMLEGVSLDTALEYAGKFDNYSVGR